MKPERPLNAEVAAHRRGRPAPLIFHLGTAVAAYQAAIAAAPAAGREDFPWHPALARGARGAPPAADVLHEALARLRKTEAGIRAWQTHPYRRPDAARRVLWQSGATRLLEYGRGPGRPVLVIPSLINTAAILDLTPATSFLDALAARGLRPVLLDWGPPGPLEAAFDLERYVTARLLPAASFLEGESGQRAALLGYCMGGTLAAILAASLPGAPALLTIGAPWAFGGGTGLAADMRLGARHVGAARLRGLLDAAAATFGLVPAALFDQLFALINPLQVARKFQRFAEMAPESAAAERFVALEDWLADGRAMSGPAAVDLLVRWQVEDALADGGWRCIGRPVRPEEIACPALVITGRRDHIAPTALAAPLAERIPGARHLEVDLGHVGMVVSARAGRDVIDPAVAFLHGLA
ncbi:MAG: hypothetical protein AAFY59_05060 [Pseudomonadota bacterium]